MTSRTKRVQKCVLHINIYPHVDFGCYTHYALWDIAEQNFHLFLHPCIAPLNLKCQMSPGHFKMPHFNILLSRLIAFQLIAACSHSKQKRIFGRGHVTNDVITLSLIWELFYGKCYYLVVLHPSEPPIYKVIWHWKISSCKGLWEGSYHYYILLL